MSRINNKNNINISAVETNHLNFTLLKIFKTNANMITRKLAIINDGNGERFVNFKKNIIPQIHNQCENIIIIGGIFLYVL